jgi:signal transduction histidine kinase
VGPRLFLLLVAAMVVIAVAADAWRFSQERTRVLAQLEREASLVTQAIEGQVAPVPRGADDPRLGGLLEDIREAKDAECVGLYSLDGQRVLAVFHPAAVDRASDVCAPAITPRLTAEAVSAHWGLGGTYNVQVAVTPADTRQGILKLVFDPDRVSGPLARFRTSLLVERALVLLAMGATLWLGIALSVTRPIRRLIAGVDEIARGNLKARVDAPAGTEVGELARAFNRLAGKLDQAQAEWRQAQESRAVLERQFRHAERLAALGKLASVIAHEVGTPLHVIAGRARHLERGLPGDDPAQADVATIREQVGRITRTMQHVLQSSRAIPVRRETVDLARLAHEASQVVRQESAVRSVDIAVSVPAGLTIVADADRLTQVLLNLLTNALAATPAGGRVDVRASAAARDGRTGVALTVTDTGTGIAPEHLERIFEPFFSTKANGGTGLGLSICRDIVRAHAGSIAADSGPATGTRFTVWLPVSPSEVPRG